MTAAIIPNAPILPVQGASLGISPDVDTSNPFAALLSMLGMTSANTQAGNDTPHAFGRPFNFDPTALVTNDTQQDLGAKAPDNIDLGLFSAELLAALTPGTPTPLPNAPEVTTFDAMQATGAVTSPAQTQQVATQPPATIVVSADNTDAALLLTATGLNIPDMAQFTKADAAPPVPAAPQSVNPDAPDLAQARPDIMTVAIKPAIIKDKATTLTTTSANTLSLPQWFEGDNADFLQFNVQSTPQRQTAQPHSTLFHANTIAGQTENAADHSAIIAQGQLDAADMSGALTPDMLGASLDGDTLTSAYGGTQPVGLHSATITLTPSASALHPATGVVAANLQAVMSGADKGKRFSLTLNPAELGRVQVDMKLDAAKKMKITLTVEKETTFHLLQRDATALQSLLNKGDGNADIVFELASDTHNFDDTKDQRQAFQQTEAQNNQSATHRLHIPEPHTDVGSSPASIPAGRVNKLV